MKIVITGGAGFIGSNIALELQKKHDDIAILDNFSTGDFRNIANFKGRVVTGDICTINWEKEFGKVDLIFHQGAITDTTVTDQQKIMDVNANSFSTLLEFANKCNAKVVYASSAGVYGSGQVPMKENQPLLPINFYSSSKIAMDSIAKQFLQKNKGMKIIGLRYFNVFGPREMYKGKMASMIYQLSEQMNRNQNPRIFKMGEQVRDHIYVDDIVLANLKAMECPENGVFNVGTGVGTSFNTVIEVLNKVLGKNLPTEYIENPYTGNYQSNTQADTILAENVLGFKSQVSFEEGVRKYMKFLGKV